MMNYSKVFLIIHCLVFGVSDRAQAQDQKNVNLVWRGIGGKSNWEITKYILFSAQGNNITKTIASERKFLINKSNGQCRFEGKFSSNDNIVLLFNFKTEQITKLFVNGIAQNDIKSFASTKFVDILDQFNEDTRLLFLPTSFELNKTKVSTSTQKIINAEKVFVFQITQSQLFDGSNFNGTIVVNTTGEITTAQSDQMNYTINGYKDIGGGLNLPTSFKNSSSAKNCTFTTVASFTDMEENKFTTL